MSLCSGRWPQQPIYHPHPDQTGCPIVPTSTKHTVHVETIHEGIDSTKSVHTLVGWGIKHHPQLQTTFCVEQLTCQIMLNIYRVNKCPHPKVLVGSEVRLGDW